MSCRQTSSADIARPLLVSSSIAAGLIHASVEVEHLEEAWGSGVFFILAACFQIAWAILVLLRPSSAGYSTGA
jgi:hypothetical protein